MTSASQLFPHGRLDAASFAAFYQCLMQLNFPLPVAEVLELRDLLNHSADACPVPEPTPDYRALRERFLTELDALEINRPHHRERLLRVLALLRTLHYEHALASRDAEVRLRLALAAGSEQQLRSRRGARLALALMLSGTLVWSALDEPGLAVQAGTALAGALALAGYRTVPLLEREHQRLRRELQRVLRERVPAVDWKRLIERLALILGFRRPAGLEVFRLEPESPPTAEPRTLH
jgi:hypothetical protein